MDPTFQDIYSGLLKSGLVAAPTGQLDATSQNYDPGIAGRVAQQTFHDNPRDFISRLYGSGTLGNYFTNLGITGQYDFNQDKLGVVGSIADKLRPIIFGQTTALQPPSQIPAGYTATGSGLTSPALQSAGAVGS